MTIKTDKNKINALNDVVKKHKIDFMVLFGSQNTGKARENSDLDIGVMEAGKTTYNKFGKLYNDISKIFKGHNIDLRFINGAEPVFLYNVLMKGQFIAGNLQEFYNYKAFAYKNFVDSKPLFELKEKLLRKRQKQLNKKVK